MKKIVIIVITVIALIGITIYADRATRVSSAGGSHPVDANVAGKTEPQLTLKDLNGKDVNLADYKGKVVFVNFWATWCDPCRIDSLADRHAESIRSEGIHGPRHRDGRGRQVRRRSLPRQGAFRRGRPEASHELPHSARHRRSRGQVRRHSRISQQLPDFARRENRYEIPRIEERRRATQGC